MTAIRTRPEAFPRFSTARRRGPLSGLSVAGFPADRPEVRQSTYRPPPLRRAAARVQVHHRRRTYEASSMPSRNIQTELTLQKKRRDAALIVVIRLCRPEPNRQRELRLVKDRPCRQRYLTPTASTLQRPSPANSRALRLPHCGHTNRPANGTAPGTPGTQLRWQTVTGTRSGLRKCWACHAPTLPLRLAETTR